MASQLPQMPAGPKPTLQDYIVRSDLGGHSPGLAQRFAGEKAQAMQGRAQDGRVRLVFPI